ncbi:MAG TPA: dephospho-CoA kinase [Aliidongia sp.]|nr:dephospho-CoA kinase [Aliidongia sp.]
MIVLGLTGSIGMGKSTAATMLRRMGLPLHDADAVVHRLLGPGGAAVREVLSAFPGVGSWERGIDRQKLGRHVFADPPALKRLERILHPKVRAANARFLAACARRRVRTVIQDVPLLYETGGDRHCDAVLVVSAPAFLQRQRVMARPGMTEAKFRAILGKQMPDRLKRSLTPYVVETGLGKRHSLIMLRRFVKLVEARHGTGSAYRHARNRPRYGNHRPRSG